MTGIADFHNHVIPGVDDGAQSIEEARSALAELASNGVSAVVATPHLAGSLTRDAEELRNRLQQIDVAFAALRESPVRMTRIERGVELLLDIPDPNLEDPRLRLAGTRFFLMEFPSMMIPPRSAQVLGTLAASGFVPIVAHPERYQGLVESIDIAAEWRAAGAYLQVNGGSLLGRYGVVVRKTALELLRRGWADYLSSDYHARGASLVAACERLLERRAGHEQALTLMRTNPARMLEGEAPLPVAPLRSRRTVWSRVAAVFNT